MLNRNWLMLVLATLLVAGCASTETQEGKDQMAGGEPMQGAQAGGVETGTADQAGQMSMDELDNPDSPLAKRTIYFEFDRSDIPTEYLDLLGEHAQYLISHPSVKVRLEGHADERGTREYNIGLGDRRAQSVRRILLFQGVANDQVETVSYGEERPAVEGHSEAAYAKNRRVEIVYIR